MRGDSGGEGPSWRHHGRKRDSRSRIAGGACVAVALKKLDMFSSKEEAVAAPSPPPPSPCVSPPTSPVEAAIATFAPSGGGSVRASMVEAERAELRTKRKAEARGAAAAAGGSGVDQVSKMD